MNPLSNHFITSFEPKSFQMCGDDLPSMPQFLWEKIFLKIPALERLKLVRTCKSWNWTVLSVFNQVSKIVSEILFVYHENVYTKCLRLEKKQNKHVNWEKILKNEVGIDQKLIASDIQVFKARTLNPPKGRYQFFVFSQTFLVIDEVRSLIFAFDMKTGERDTINLGHKATDIIKLSDTSFITQSKNELNRFDSFKLWQLKQNENSFEKTNGSLVFPKESNLKTAFNKNSMLIYYVDQTNGVLLLDLTFFSLESHSVTNNLTLNLPEWLTYCWIKEFSESFVVIENEMGCCILNLIKKTGHHFLGCKFLLLKEHKAFLFSEINKTVYEIHLGTPPITKNPLAVLENSCLAAYEMKDFIYFVTERKFHMYSNQINRKFSFDVIESPVEQICKCDFIRVTEEIVMLLLCIADTEQKATYSQIVVYKLEDILKELNPKNLWKFSPQEEYLNAGNYIVGRDFIEQEDAAETFSLTPYYFGVEEHNQSNRFFNTHEIQFNYEVEEIVAASPSKKRKEK